jgi:hypothetical protein
MSTASAKTIRCPVQGCGKRKDEWGKKSYPLPSPDIFTLQLNAQIDVTINNRICQPCWSRDRDHTMRLDGRTRVVPMTSSSPLDALLSAISPPPPFSTSPSTPPFLSSQLSSPPTPAHVITPFPAFRVAQSPTTVSTPLRRTRSSPPILDLSPAPSTYAERQRDVVSRGSSIVVAIVMAGIDYVHMTEVDTVSYGAGWGSEVSIDSYNRFPSYPIIDTLQQPELTEIHAWTRTTG